MNAARGITCFICRRRRDPKHMDGTRCKNREVCFRVAAKAVVDPTPAQVVAKRLGAKQ